MNRITKTSLPCHRDNGTSSLPPAPQLPSQRQLRHRPSVSPPQLTQNTLAFKPEPSPQVSKRDPGPRMRTVPRLTHYVGTYEGSCIPSRPSRRGMPYHRTVHAHTERYDTHLTSPHLTSHPQLSPSTTAVLRTLQSPLPLPKDCDDT